MYLFFNKTPRNDWYCWHLILSTGVTPSGKMNKAVPLCSALVCSAKVFYVAFAVREHKRLPVP